MVELIVVRAFILFVCAVWVAVCIKSHERLVTGLFVAGFIPIFVALMVLVSVYVVHCFNVILS